MLEAATFDNQSNMVMLLILLISVSLIRLADAANLRPPVPLWWTPGWIVNCFLSVSLSLPPLAPGFVVFVGLVLPGSMVAMWMFWECCYEVDEEDEEDSRSAMLTSPSPPHTHHIHIHMHMHIHTHTHTHTHIHTQSLAHND